MSRQSKMAYHILKHLETIVDQLHLSKQEKVIVALSGGPDSVALAHAVHQLQQHGVVQVSFCHLNHQLRGADADADENWVQEFARDLHVPCFVKRLPIKALAQQHGWNEEATGRYYRYQFFREVAYEIGAKTIFLAHHADDQAETMVWRMIRGAGTEGLSGIPEVRIEDGYRYVRPFMKWTKNELLSYCKEQQLSYRIDFTNEDIRYTRNAIRHELMPILKKFNPNVVSQLCHTANILDAEDQWMSNLTSEWANSHIEFQTDPKHASWSRAEFIELPIALQRRVIKLILSYLSLHNESFSFSRFEAIRISILREDLPNQTVLLSKQHQLSRTYDLIQVGEFVGSATIEYEYEWFPLQQPVFELPGIRFEFSAQIMDSSEWQTGTTTNELNFAIPVHQLHQPLTIRNRKPGDRMVWFADGRRKKIQDAWVDAKWSAKRRSLWPLVFLSDELIWIPGFRLHPNLKNGQENQQLVVIHGHSDFWE